MDTKEEKQEQGFVYVLTNPCMPGLVKIGMTKRNEMKERLRELYTTGVPLPFECEFACRVNESDCGIIENALHEAFKPQRINDSREFFSIAPEQAKAILKLFHHEDATVEVSQEIETNLTTEDKSAREKSMSKRPPINFFDMGLKKDDVLVFKSDNSKTCSIVDQKHVLYKSVITTLTPITTKLLERDYNVQPTPYWKTKDGRDLIDLYNETYPKEEMK
jgi:hypothetical protein